MMDLRETLKVREVRIKSSRYFEPLCTESSWKEKTTYTRVYGEPSSTQKRKQASPQDARDEYTGKPIDCMARQRG